MSRDEDVTAATTIRQVLISRLSEHAKRRPTLISNQKSAIGVGGFSSVRIFS
jgi:hypothetical protein